MAEAQLAYYNVPVQYVSHHVVGDFPQPQSIYLTIC